MEGRASKASSLLHDLLVRSSLTRAASNIGFPIGPIVVPFWASYLEAYKVIPKRYYYGAYG